MDIDEVIAGGRVRTVFQPIVELDTGRVVAGEALSRGPAGPLERPDLLFAAAREAGRLADLDALCRRTAVRTAARTGWPAGAALFVNVEPEILDVADLDELVRLADRARLQVVLEVTERAIGRSPAQLLGSVHRLRNAGWRIALDDVGADDLSLAFMPLLRPDVVKLDLRLVQERPGPDIARIMTAVSAYAERSGALVLAEGIEHERHLDTALALGARLGQGWMFGRPAPALEAAAAWGGPVRAGGATPATLPRSPFGCLPSGTTLRRSTKALLIELSKHLETQARAQGATCVVLSTFQFAHHFTPHTARRYATLAEEVGFVGAIGRDLPAEPVTGVRGADLDADDPVRDEWDIAVLAPHFAAALLARDLGDTGPEASRRFEYALTYDRAVVGAAAESLMARIAPTAAVAGDDLPAQGPEARDTAFADSA